MKEHDDAIETLRRAADEVAHDLPVAPARAHARSRRIRWVAAAACLLALCLLAPFLLQEVFTAREVEVELLRVDGRDVPARVIDDAEAGAILVRPAPRTRAAAVALAGELP